MTNKLKTLIAILLFAITLLAQPPELDHVIYGLFDYGCGEITMEDGYVVEARKSDGTTIATFRIGSDIELANHFVLRVPMSLTSDPNKAIGGEELDIVIVDGEGIPLFTNTHVVTTIGSFAGRDMGDGQGGDIANAGVDQFVCTITTTLDANVPVFGTGEWTLLTGTGGLISDPLNPNSEFSGQIGEIYQLQWTITSAACPTSTDMIEISFSELLTQADAGDDLQICGDYTQLNGNLPIIGEGMWSIFSGGAGSFEDPFDPYTMFFGQAGSVYTLRWTISNESCDDSVDEVLITMNAANSPDLVIDGPISSYCSEGVTLVASEGYDSYQWSHGPTTRTIHVDGVGLSTYTVTGSLNNGCERIATHQVDFVPENPLEIEVIVDLPSQSMCSLDAPFALRTLGACGGQGPFTFEWTLLNSPPEGGFIADPLNPETTLTPYGTGLYVVQLVVEDSQNQFFTVSFTLVVPHLEDNDGNGILDTDDWWFRVNSWREDVTVYPWLDADLDGRLNVIDLMIAYPCESSYPAAGQKREGR